MRKDDPPPRKSATEVRLSCARNEYEPFLVPAEAAAGEYRGSVKLSSGDWRQEFPVLIDLWDFALPKASSIRSSFGLSIENIKPYYNLETRDEVEKVTDLYYQNFRDHRRRMGEVLEKLLAP